MRYVRARVPQGVPGQGDAHGALQLRPRRHARAGRQLLLPAAGGRRGGPGAGPGPGRRRPGPGSRRHPLPVRLAGTCAPTPLPQPSPPSAPGSRPRPARCPSAPRPPRTCGPGRKCEPRAPGPCGWGRQGAPRGVRTPGGLRRGAGSAPGHVGARGSRPGGVASASVHGRPRRVPASPCACLSGWGGAARRLGPGQAGEACAPRVLGLVWGRPRRSRLGPWPACARPAVSWMPGGGGGGWQLRRAPGDLGPGRPRARVLVAAFAPGPDPGGRFSGPWCSDSLSGFLHLAVLGFRFYSFVGAGLGLAWQAGALGLRMLVGMWFITVGCRELWSRRWRLPAA